jgi:hypothetical protein
MRQKTWRPPPAVYFMTIAHGPRARTRRGWELLAFNKCFTSSNTWSVVVTARRAVQCSLGPVSNMLRARGEIYDHNKRGMSWCGRAAISRRAGPADGGCWFDMAERRVNACVSTDWWWRSCAARRPSYASRARTIVYGADGQQLIVPPRRRALPHMVLEKFPGA